MRREGLRQKSLKSCSALIFMCLYPGVWSKYLVPRKTCFNKKCGNKCLNDQDKHTWCQAPGVLFRLEKWHQEGKYPCKRGETRHVGGPFSAPGGRTGNLTSRPGFKAQENRKGESPRESTA